MLIVVLIILLIFLVALKFGGADQPPAYYMGEMWFNWSVSGKKTVDVRPGPAGKYDNLKGQTITYKHKKDTFDAKVTDIKHYKDFESLIKAEGVDNVAPGKTAAEFVSMMSKYYDPKDASVGGVNAIHFKLVKDAKKGGKPKKSKSSKKTAKKHKK
jgi:ASC-1-like (ASCH) protein